jgi:hypothetical protein
MIYEFFMLLIFNCNKYLVSKFNLFVENFLVQYMFQKKTFGSYNSERSNYLRILLIIQGTLLHSYGFAYVKLNSMMQIYLYEMPTNLLASNETNVSKWKRQPNSRLDKMYFITPFFFCTSLVCVVARRTMHPYLHDCYKILITYELEELSSPF